MPLPRREEALTSLDTTQDDVSLHDMSTATPLRSSIVRPAEVATQDERPSHTFPADSSDRNLEAAITNTSTGSQSGRLHVDRFPDTLWETIKGLMNDNDPNIGDGWAKNGTCRHTPMWMVTYMTSEISTKAFSALMNGSLRRPYLQRVQRLSAAYPHLEYLAHWMEVTAAPTKWKWLRFFSENRDVRAAKTNVGIVDWSGDKPPSVSRFRDITNLQKALSTVTAGFDAASPRSRLIVVEDLSRDVIELLGTRYNVDPWFFRSHISDYLSYNTRDPWAELPELTERRWSRNYFTLRHLRARYYPNEEDYQQAEFESGSWNVLRRLDSDRSRKRLMYGMLDRPGASVALGRAKTSLWIDPKRAPGEALAIILVDPTVTSGHPVWGHAGSQPFCRPVFEALSMPTTGASYFEEVLFWSANMTKRDLDLVRADPKLIGLQAYRLIVHDWFIALEVIRTQLVKLDWELERPDHWENFEEHDATLKKSTSFERNIQFYQDMVDDLQVLSEGAPYINDNVTLLAFQEDILRIRNRLISTRDRLASIRDKITTYVSIEESRRTVAALEQNRSIGGLTVLATIFLPLSFATSFLSMSSNFSTDANTFWLFFAIGGSLLALTLLAIGFMSWVLKILAWVQNFIRWRLQPGTFGGV